MLRFPLVDGHAEFLMLALGPMLPLAFLAAVLHELTAGAGLKGRAGETAVGARGERRLFRRHSKIEPGPAFSDHRNPVYDFSTFPILDRRSP